MLRPLDDRIVVQPMPSETQGTEHKGLIVLPDTSDKGPARRGTVVAVGPGRLVKSCANDKVYVRRPVDVQVGQVVQFGIHSIDAEWNGLAVIREQDILVIEN